MPWIRRMVRSPVFLQVVVVVLQLAAAQIAKHEHEKRAEK